LRWKYLVTLLAGIAAASSAQFLYAECVGPVPPTTALFGTVLVVTVTLLAAHHCFLAKPLGRILQGADRIVRGDPAHRIGRMADPEMDAIAGCIDRLADQATHSRTELEAQVADRTADLQAVIEEVHERSRIVEEVNRRLAEVDRKRTRFLTNVSHELRTPLNSILGYLKLLLDGMADSEEEAREFLENARASATLLQQLVTDVLAASQFESGRIKLNLQALHPGDLICDVLRMLEVQIRGKEVALRMEASGKAMVVADEARVRQVLANLVGNAIKFTDRGEILVRCREEGDMVRFEVSDTGAGIPAAELDKIFEKFHQVPAPDLRHKGGTGIGLTIARDLVQLMGGTLHAESEGPGRGARFVFTLPAAPAGAAPSSAGQRTPASRRQGD